MLDMISKCIPMTSAYIYMLLVLTIIISLICYAKIFKIIRYQTKRNSQFKSSIPSFRHSVRQYKATSVVIGYLVVILTTGVAYIVIVSLTVMAGLPTTYLRTPVDVVNIFNCSMDSCLYVICFRECRLELLKILSCVVPNAQTNITTMRYNVLGYVPRDFIKRKSDAITANKAITDVIQHI